MTYEEALEKLKDHPHIKRFKELCSEDNPNFNQREKYRNTVIKKAGGEGRTYPSARDQIKSFGKAMWKFATSGFETVPEVKQQERLAICKECPFFVEKDFRCLKCGCGLQLKTLIASSHCPINKW